MLCSCRLTWFLSVQFRPSRRRQYAASTRGKAVAKKGVKRKPAAKRKDNIAEEAIEKLLKARETKGKLPFSQKLYTVKEITPAAKVAYLTLWKKVIHNHAEPLEKAMRAYFNSQEKEVIANARHQMKRRTKEAAWREERHR
jgi:hypothetical protein